MKKKENIVEEESYSFALRIVNRNDPSELYRFLMNATSYADSSTAFLNQPD